MRSTYARPAAWLVSVGAKNTFGHPAPATLARLAGPGQVAHAGDQVPSTPDRARRHGLPELLVRRAVVLVSVVADPGGVAEHVPDRHEMLDRQKSQPLGRRYCRRARRWTASFAVLVQSKLEQALCPERGFVEAFRVARFTPNVVMKVGDIFSLMNLVSGNVGCTVVSWTQPRRSGNCHGTGAW